MIDLSHLRLAQLGFGVRFGLTLFLALMVGGYFAGLKHMEDHVGPKDGNPKLEMIDIEASYSGVDRPSRLLEVLKEPVHRGYVSEKELEALMRWLQPKPQASRSIDELIAAGYEPENIPDEEPMPAEILEQKCQRCHAVGAKEGDEKSKNITLENWAEIDDYAYPKKLDPMDPKIRVASMHAHIPAISTFALLVFGLLLVTGWPTFVRHGLFALGFLALVADFLGMWISQDVPMGAQLVAYGGAAFGVCLGLSILLLLLELWVAPFLRGAHEPPE